MTSLDVVVCNYRTSADLTAFLDSYEKYRPALCDLTVVNVAPKEADILVARNCGARYLEFAENVGYARACNRAARDSNADILAFFNADVRLTEGALDRCRSALQSHAGWGVLGPRQVDDDGRITHAGIFGSNTAPRHRGWKERDRGQYDEWAEAVTVSGAAYFVKRIVWDQLTQCQLYRNVAPEAEGGFLPTPLFYEETWLSYHARVHGWSVIYFGEVTVVHRWHASVNANGKSDAYRRLERARSMFREACDHHGIFHD